MKNQYIGDIGDYGKYALLRAFACHYSIGVNWYLTPPDGKSDGKFTDYLLQDNDSLDNELFQKLKVLLLSPEKILLHENRHVAAIENSGILPNTRFFSEELDFSQALDRKAYRKNWVSRSIDRLGQQDIIFLDPDNGLEVKSVPPTRKDGNKYVTYEEVRQYYEKAKVALIIYNHRDRSPEETYAKRFLRFFEYEGTQDAFVYRLTFRKGSMRDFVFITKPPYFKEIYDLLHAFVCPARDKYFSIAHLPMPLVNRWAFDPPPKVISKEEWQEQQKEYIKGLAARKAKQKI